MAKSSEIEVAELVLKYGISVGEAREWVDLIAYAFVEGRGGYTKRMGRQLLRCRRGGRVTITFSSPLDIDQWLDFCITNRMAPW